MTCVVALLLAGCSSSTAAAPTAVPLASPAPSSAPAVASPPSPAVSSPAAVPSPSIALAASPSPSGPLTTVTVFTTAVTGAFAGVWTGIEAGYFRDEGIDVQLTQLDSSSRAVPGLLAGQGDLSTLDGQTTVDADVKGANVKIILGVTNQLVYSIMAQPEITSGADLKGKRIGITSPGSASDTVARQALQVFGLQPSDVALIPLQSNPGVVAGLAAKQVDAGVLSPPTNTQAAQVGMHEILNLATQGPPYAATVIGGTSSYVDAHQTLMLGFVRAYSRGIQRFKTDQAYGTSVLQKYLQIDDPTILQPTWSQFAQYVANPPLVDPQALQNAITTVSASDPSAAGTGPADYVDAQFVQTLQSQGLYQQLGVSQ